MGDKLLYYTQAVNNDNVRAFAGFYH